MSYIVEVPFKTFRNITMSIVKILSKPWLDVRILPSVLRTSPKPSYHIHAHFHHRVNRNLAITLLGSGRKMVLYLLTEIGI